MTLLVVARVPLPDIAPMGAPVRVKASARIRGLAAKGHVQILGIAPHDHEAEPLPSGTTSELLEWAGDDPARAAALLERERSSTAPRKALSERLASIIDPLGPTHPDDDWHAGDDWGRLTLVGV